jgi:hypothetical protein
MTQFVLERSFDPALTRQDVVALARTTGWCFQAYRVNWHGSMLGRDGSTLVCRFEAADAESIRLALHQAQADMTRAWVGTVHEGPAPVAPNVIVERDFDSPADLDALQTQEVAHQWCLDAHGVRFARTYFSQDRRRMLCLYAAADAEAVRLAQEKAGMPFTRVWTFELISMADLDL